MNFKATIQFLALACLVATTSLSGGVYFHSTPGNVDNGQSYMIGATYYPPYGTGGDLSIYKNYSWLDGSSAWGTFAVETWTSDSGPATVDFMAEGIDWELGYTEYDYAQVSVSGTVNQAPVATVEVDGYSSGATVTRPYGGSVSITVRFKATDGNGNLSGIRPQVWSPDAYLNNNGAQFIAQTGSSGEVVWTVVLNQNGDWYFWTDATDHVIAPNYTDSGPWTAGFRLTVNEATPPNRPPTATVWANVSSLYTGQTAQIYVRGQDEDGNARYFNLDQVSPLDCFYGPGDNFVSSQQPNNGEWDLGSNIADYTRTVNMTFDRPGTYVWRGAAMDSAGSGWQHSATNHTITVPNRDPSVSIQILDAGQNVIGLDGNGRARIPINTNFYIRVSGSDPDGRLLRLYSRVNNAAGTGYAYEQQDVSGGSATGTFGPYNTGTSVGVWDVWGHVEDQDNGGYQWQGGGWWGAHSPDIEVYVSNSPPTVTWHDVPVTFYKGSIHYAKATGSDADGNLVQVIVQRSIDGGATWQDFDIEGFAATTSHTNDGNPYTIPWEPGTTVAYRAIAVDSSGTYSDWIGWGPVAVATDTPSQITSHTLNGSASDITVAVGTPVVVETTASDVNGNMVDHTIYWDQGNGSEWTHLYDGTGSYPSVSTGWTAANFWAKASQNGSNSYRTATYTPTATGTYYIMAWTWDGVDADWRTFTRKLTVVASLPSTYALAVENGSGGGSGLAAGSVQNITANTPPAGQQFSGWSPVSGPGTFGNAAATSTTFTMGSGNATVRANYSLPSGGDTDGDGMPNDWETANGLDPNNAADATGDADGDGVMNLAEYRLGTNPAGAAQPDSGNATELKVHRPNQ